MQTDTPGRAAAARQPHPAPTHAVIVARDGRGGLVTGGLTGLERWRRVLASLSVDTVSLLLVTEPQHADELAALTAAWSMRRPANRRGPFVQAAATTPGHEVAWIADHWRPGTDDGLIVDADAVIDPRILRALVAQPGQTAAVDSRPPAEATVGAGPQAGRTTGWLCGAAVLARHWLVTQPGSLADVIAAGLEDGAIATLDVESLSCDAPTVRRFLRPRWFRTPEDPAIRVRLGCQLARDTKKGAPDLPALIHAPLERVLVTWLAPTAITPNQISLAVFLVALVGTWCFVTGRLGPGLAVAAAVGVLDGVDGRLARLRLETSRLGTYEHVLDFLFEWSWWIALAWHFQSAGGWTIGLALAGAELIDGLAKGLVLWTTGRTIDEPSVFDRLVRLVGGRRNIYVWILAAGALAGTPSVAFQLLPWWEATTAALHLPRALWLVWSGRGRRASPDQSQPS